MHYSTVFTKYVQLCNAFTCANTAVTCVLFDEFMCPYTLTVTLYSAVTTGPIHSVVTCVLCPYPVPSYAAFTCATTVYTADTCALCITSSALTHCHQMKHLLLCQYR